MDLEEETEPLRVVRLDSADAENKILQVWLIRQ
jgi:anti-sigma-K factor RskA